MGLSNLGKYNLWAGEKTRNILKNLTEEEFTQDLGIPFGSIRDKCLHILLALETCFATLEAKLDELIAQAPQIEKMSNQELLNKWAERDQQLAEALQGNTSGTVKVLHLGEPFTMNQGDFYLQYVNHTTYHRGQLVLALKKLGKEAVGTDYIMYFDELRQESL
ncbi:MAG: DinB family protein [Candidatus Hodarchaeota archaeon]